MHSRIEDSIDRVYSLDDIRRYLLFARQFKPKVTGLLYWNRVFKRALKRVLWKLTEPVLIFFFLRFSVLRTMFLQRAEKRKFSKNVNNFLFLVRC